MMRTVMANKKRTCRQNRSTDVQHMYSRVGRGPTGRRKGGQAVAEAGRQSGRDPVIRQLDCQALCVREGESTKQTIKANSRSI